MRGGGSLSVVQTFTMRVCTPSMRGEGVTVCSTDLYNEGLYTLNERGGGSLSVVQAFIKRVCSPSMRGGHCL